MTDHLASNQQRAALRRFVNAWLFSSKDRTTSGMPWDHDYVEDVVSMLAEHQSRSAYEPAAPASKEEVNRVSYGDTQKGYLWIREDQHDAVVERLKRENECIRSWAPDVQAQIDDLTKFTSTELLPSKPPGWAGHYGGSSLKTAIHYLREYMRLRASVEPPAVKRYDWEDLGTGYSSYRTLTEQPGGDWVKWDDVAPHLRSAQPPRDARMKVALELMALNVQQEDENGPIAGALCYGDVEMICYHGLGMIPMKDPELRARLEKLEHIERDRASATKSVQLTMRDGRVEVSPTTVTHCDHGISLEDPCEQCRHPTEKNEALVASPDAEMHRRSGSSDSGSNAGSTPAGGSTDETSAINGGAGEARENVSDARVRPQTPHDPGPASPAHETFDGTAKPCRVCNRMHPDHAPTCTYYL